MAKRDEQPGTGSKSRLKSKRRGKSSKSKLTWIEPHIAGTDKKWLEDHIDDAERYVADMVAGLPESYVFTVRYNTFLDRWQAQCMCFDDDDPNNQCGLVGRGATPFAASYVLAYLLSEVVSDAWEQREAQDDLGMFG